jgi:uncharacterized DUF497 family protein
MRIEFDPAKDLHNRAKHGVSLALAERLDMESAILVRDDRQDYGETRFNAYGLIDGQLFALTFVVRGLAVRAISLRRARPKEIRRYERRESEKD